MSLDIEPELEAERVQRASAEGVSVNELVGTLLHRNCRKNGFTPIRSVDPANDASIALVQSWLARDATEDPEEIRKAEEDLIEFKRNMNKPRKETGARLHFPEVE